MENKDNKEIPTIGPDEYSVAQTEAEKLAIEGGDYTYTHKFRKPFTYMGAVYTELRFDWDSLTGRDSLAIEAELQALGNPVVVPAFSGAYLIRMAAKACTVKIGADAFEYMPLAEYNKVRNSARSFLLASE